MLSDIAAKAMADLLELDSDQGRAPTKTEAQWDFSYATEVAYVLQPAKTLTDLPVEVLKSVFNHLFACEELLFAGFMGVNPVLRTTSDAWPTQLFRISKSLFNVASEAFNEAIDNSKLIYEGCLPPFPYQGNDYIYAPLGKDNSNLSHFIHEKFLERHGPSFRDVEILGLHHRGQPNLQPFVQLKTLTVGTIVISWMCTKADGVAWEDYLYTLYHNELLHWTKYAGCNQPYYFCSLIMDNERGYNIHLKMRLRCLCHGVWTGIIDVDGKKAIEVEQVESTADQDLNSA